MIIEQYPRGDLVHAYFDDSSEETITNGGSEVFLTTPSGRTYECRPSASAIAPDFTCEFHKPLPAKQGKTLFSVTQKQPSRLLQKGGSFYQQNLFSPDRNTWIK